MRIAKKLCLSLAVVYALCATTESAQAARAKAAPVLVLQITVDQLRGDMLPRYRDRFGRKGFRLLMDRGLYYTNAHYGTGNTFTAAGHAVLVTGADTAEHGMVANEWFDRDSGKVMYSTFDAQHGMSPANLTSTTIGDELISATSGSSRAFAIAGKDRSAIIPAGHLGKAFWFSDEDGGFTTSTYYYGTPPVWLSAWNDHKLIEGYRQKSWQPISDKARYLNGRNADNTHARPDAGITFPHSLAIDDPEKFIAAFRATPFLDEHTLNFVKELIQREKVGQGAHMRADTQRAEHDICPSPSICLSCPTHLTLAQ